MELILFAKSFQSLTLSRLCRVATDLGFSGIDLTVRSGGFVDPDLGAVEDNLTRAVRTIRDHGLNVPLLTTSLLSSDDPTAEAIFHTAGTLGIPWIKLGYYLYDEGRPFIEALDDARRKLDGIQRLAGQAGVGAVVHNHSGSSYVSAMPMAVYQLVRDRDPRAVAAYLDVAHLMAEGARGSWKQGLDLLLPFTRVVAAKSFGLPAQEGSTSLARKWSFRVVPFEEGAVPWRFFAPPLARRPKARVEPAGKPCYN